MAWGFLWILLLHFYKGPVLSGPKIRTLTSTPTPYYSDMHLNTLIPNLKFDYTLDENGTLKNKTTKTTITPCLSLRGYYTYSVLFKPGFERKSTTMTRARLMALAFIPNPLNLPQVDHIDGNKTNDVLSNLRWCTAEDNIRWEHERYGRVLISFADVLRYRERHTNGETWRVLAQAAGYAGSSKEFSRLIKRRKI